MRETKKDHILRLHGLGLEAAPLTPAEIARVVHCSATYVYVVIWRAAHEGYHGRWMAQKRASDPAYYARELARQRKYDRRKSLARRRAAKARRSVDRTNDSPTSAGGASHHV